MKEQDQGYVPIFTKFVTTYVYHNQNSKIIQYKYRNQRGEEIDKQNKYIENNVQRLYDM